MENKNENSGVVIQTIVKRLGNLLTVKSIVTVALTGVFSYLSVKGVVSQEFMSIYTMIVGFYFGTQAKKEE